MPAADNYAPDPKMKFTFGLWTVGNVGRDPCTTGKKFNLVDVPVTKADIARAIRRFRPDAVVVGSWDVEFVAGLNQADHRVVWRQMKEVVNLSGPARVRWAERKAPEDFRSWWRYCTRLTAHRPAGRRSDARRPGSARG